MDAVDDPRSPLPTTMLLGSAAALLFQSKKLVALKPDLSIDGRRILFGCFVRAQEQEDLRVMRADGSGVHRVVATPGAWENFPVWD